VAAALPHLRRSRGSVVVIGSGLAVANVPHSAAYSASKRGLIGWADVLRLEHRDELTVSAVQPGYIRTAIHEAAAARGVSLDGMTRIETVEDAATAIVAALETGRRELGSSPVLTAELWLARRFPATTDRVIAARVRRAPQAILAPTEPERETASR
jgi:short-subunit dehydrogenase